MSHTFIFPSSAVVTILWAIRGIDKRVHRVEVTLLLQDVRFRLPLPYQQLTKLRRPECKPFSRLVDSHEIDFVLGDAQAVDHIEIGHLVEAKNTVGEAGDEEV